jgi:FdhD protein
MGRVTVRRPVVKVSARGRAGRPDALAAEEPLEIRVNGRALAVTMRTPGNDIELAHGFLLTEGVITDRTDVSTARYCDGVDEDGKNTYNVLDIALADGVPPPDTGVERNFYTTSSCGVCGKAALDAVRLRTRFSPAADESRVSTTTLVAMPDALRAAQRVFETTGGLHGAGLFRSDGTLLAVREDIGRHNAVDKVIGWALLEGRVPLSGCVLLVSGRASFELVQKAAMAGIPVLAAVSAPSSLAVELAEDSGMTLIGFLRGDTMNLYTGADRVAG